jgi:hypothetical protein
MRIFESTVDALTGMRTTIGAQDGKLIVKKEQDVEPMLDHSTMLRNAPEYSAGGIKANWWHCVHIPEAVALQMLTEDGFDVYCEPAKEIRKFLSRNRAKYSRLFTTAGKF